MIHQRHYHQAPSQTQTCTIRTLKIYLYFIESCGTEAFGDAKESRVQTSESLIEVHPRNSV
jgi:hypothetical protein